MKFTPKLTLFFLLCFSASFTATLFAFPLWLDPPQRSNPNDPKSSNFHPTPVETDTPVAPVGTNTVSPTYSATPTFSYSPTAPGTFTNSPTATPSYTVSPTPSASPTSSSTPQGPQLLYDGTTVGYRLQDSPNCATHTNAAGAAGVIETNVGGADPGCTDFLQLTLTGAVGTYYGEVTYYTAGAPFNVQTNDNALSVWFKVPSNGCTTDFRGSIYLLYSGGGGYPDDHSVPVTLTTYLVGTCITTYDTWLQAVIPFGAFEGNNYEGGTFTAGSLQTINGFQVAANTISYVEPNGSLPNSEIDIGQVECINSGSLPAVRSFGKLYDDFECQYHTTWGNYQWVAASDSITCTSAGPVTSFTFPSSLSIPPVDSGGNSLSACHSGHIEGYVNACTNCGTNPSSYPYPYAELESNVSLDGYGNTIDISNNAYVDFSPNTGAKGMIFRMKSNQPNIGQVYLVRLIRGADITSGNYDNYKSQIADSSLSSSWQAFVMPFPADGSETTHTGSSDTELTFAQSGWGTPLPWARNDLMQITVMPNNIGMNFDIWIDDVQFY